MQLGTFSSLSLGVQLIEDIPFDQTGAKCVNIRLGMHLPQHSLKPQD